VYFISLLYFYIIRDEVLLTLSYVIFQLKVSGARGNQRIKTAKKKETERQILSQYNYLSLLIPTESIEVRIRAFGRLRSLGDQ
jgi:hypothetical protein